MSQVEIHVLDGYHTLERSLRSDADFTQINIPKWIAIPDLGYVHLVITAGYLRISY